MLLPDQLFDLSANMHVAAYQNLEQVTKQSLPMLGYVVAVRQSFPKRAAACLSIFALVVHLLWRRPDYLGEVLVALIAFIYYLAAAIVSYRFERRVLALSISKDALLCSTFFLFVAFPAILFRPLGAVPLLVLGWQMALSTYSYCVDARLERERPSFGGYAFFVFVDPSLVYPERARRVEGARSVRRGIGRVLTGFLWMTAGAAALRAFPEIADLTALPGNSALGRYGTTLIHGSLVLIVTYILRSGLVDMQIGTLSSLGYQVRESYVRPYLARDPVDFWRRWNLYVGHWARRYVFGPVALAVARAQRRRWPAASKQLAPASAVIVTFLFIGLLHDGLNFIGEAKTYFHYVQAFGVGAFALLLWEAKSAFTPAAARKWLESRLASSAGRVYLVHYLVAIVVVVGVI